MFAGVDLTQVGQGSVVVALLALIGKIVLKDQSGQERLAGQYEKQWHTCEVELAAVRVDLATAQRERHATERKLDRALDRIAALERHNQGDRK
jgi:hypothetical protein